MALWNRITSELALSNDAALINTSVSKDIEQLLRQLYEDMRKNLRTDNFNDIDHVLPSPDQATLQHIELYFSNLAVDEAVMEMGNHILSVDDDLLKPDSMVDTDS